MVKLGQVPFLFFNLLFSHLMINSLAVRHEQCCLINYSQMGLQFQWGTAQVGSTYILILLTYICDNLLILKMHYF